jgi:hypothetical protein
MEDEIKRGRGRPKGSKNKPKINSVAVVEPPHEPVTRQVPHTTVPFQAYQADPDRVIAKQLTMLAWQQDLLHKELTATAVAGKFSDYAVIEKLETLSNGIVRAVDAMKKYDGFAEELRRRMSPAETLEKAIQMIEGQDLATLQAIIKRLRQHRQKIAPVVGFDKMQMGEGKSATELMAELAAESNEVR